jgi:putative addiction module component (TIGR02574 family)
MVNPALLASVDALPVEDQIQLVEHINGRLSAATSVSEEDRALITARASDTDPNHWTRIEDFNKRMRDRLA